MTERELLVDCLRRLNRAGLTYMVTGSMASNYWGVPRTTHDIDFVLQLPPSVVSQLVLAFQGDFFIDEESVRNAHRPPYQFNAIDSRSALKVDFWLLHGVPFEREMFSRRLQASLFDQPAWLATAEDVILHKLYWNRLTPSDRQMDDAAGVVAVQGPRLNTDYLRRWASELDVSAAIEDLLSGRRRPKRT